jgi:hypothetical protein
VGTQLNSVEDVPETTGAGESQELSPASLGPLQASLVSSLSHQGINDLEVCISHPKRQNCVNSQKNQQINIRKAHTQILDTIQPVA